MTLTDEKYVNGDPEEEPEEEEEEDEEDLVDPMDEIKTDCQNSKACSGYKLELEKCEKRVTAAAKTEEDCTQELFDFITCADHCMSKELFSKLK